MCLSVFSQVVLDHCFVCLLTLTKATLRVEPVHRVLRLALLVFSMFPDFFAKGADLNLLTFVVLFVFLVAVMRGALLLQKHQLGAVADNLQQF